MGINFLKFGNNYQQTVQKSSVQNPASFRAKFNTGILNKDIVSFSGLWDNRGYYPYTDKTTQVSMHHDLNGYNSDIRYTLNRLNKGIAPSEEDAWLLNAIDKIDAEFENLPPLEDDFVFYRGRSRHPVIERFNIDFPIIENAKEGDIIVPDNGYSYGAFKKELAACWADGYNTDNMMYEIHVPQGAKVSRNLEHGGEVIFPRSSKYRLISKEKDSRGVLNVVLEYILPEENK